VFAAMGVISAPTDAAWAAKVAEMNARKLNALHCAAKGA
jgi:hypothetical protein